MRRNHARPALRPLLIVGILASAAPLGDTARAGAAGRDEPLRPAEAASPSPGSTPESPAGIPVPEGVEVSYDKSGRITWYKPKLDPWQEFKVRAIPILAVADDGARKIVFMIEVKDSPKGRPTSIQLTTEEGPWSVPIADSDEIRIHDSGCRVTQTILLQNQLALVEKLAAVTRAEIALPGYRIAVRYKMSGDDLAIFKRMADLWKAPRLPSVPPTPAKRDPPEGVFVAGVGNVQNPEIIKSSKVKPRFPKAAEGKETREFDGRMYVMEHGLRGDFAFIKAWKGDCWGNLIYRKTARNFNPMMATAADYVIAEVEELVDLGQLDSNQVHTPGIFVDAIFQGPKYEKRIERRTTRK